MFNTGGKKVVILTFGQYPDRMFSPSPGMAILPLLEFLKKISKEFQSERLQTWRMIINGSIVEFLFLLVAIILRA
jgi:hypothetical protein